MPKVSRTRIDPQHLSFFLNNFWGLVTLLENKDQVKNFLKDLLTHTEMKMLAKRTQIAKMLLEGYSYQDIRGYVKVTDSTIARISNILATGGDALKTVISYLQKIEEDLEKERMRVTPNLKNKYPAYFLPEIILDKVKNKVKVKKKSNSAKQTVSL